MRVIILLHWRAQLLTLDGRARPSKALLHQIGMITERSVHVLSARPVLCRRIADASSHVLSRLPRSVPDRSSGLFQTARCIWARKKRGRQLQTGGDSEMS